MAEPSVALVLLLSTRIAAMLLTAPLFGAAGLPGPVRALLAIALATAAALPLLGHWQAPADIGGLALAFAREIALGALFGLGVLAAFAGFGLAGRLLDVQIGLGIGQVLGPWAHTPVPLLNAVFNLLALVLFFAVNGHHALLRGIAFSLERFPVGQPWPAQAAAGALLAQVGGLFTLGFALAAPLVMALLLVEFALAVVARTLPQANMLALGIPVKILAGWLLLALLAGSLAPGSARLFAGIHRAWEAVFAQGASQGPRR